MTLPAAGPLLKWPGGKSGELAQILPALPPVTGRYLEPFVGGGAVLFALPPHVPAEVNDASVDLIDLYARVQRPDPGFLARMDALDRWWADLDAFGEERGAALAAIFRDSTDEGSLRDRAARLVAAARPDLVALPPPEWLAVADTFADVALETVPAKLVRMRRVEARKGEPLPPADLCRNVEGAFKAACYVALRALYNRGRGRGERSERQSAAFLFLREYAYAAMFRFNARGQFNVPYGGITYNRKRLAPKLAHLRSEPVRARLQSTRLHCGDFEAFLDASRPGPDDVVFVDPPYDSRFSDYDRASFSAGDHARLAQVLRRLPSRFQLVIKATPTVVDLYRDERWHVTACDKTYRWTIKDRNDRAATHLMITNYEPPSTGGAQPESSLLPHSLRHDARTGSDQTSTSPPEIVSA